MPIFLPDLSADDPYGIIINSSEMLYFLDPKFWRQCDVESICNVYKHQQHEYARLMSNLEHIPKQFHDTTYKNIIENATPVKAIAEKTRTCCGIND